MSEPLRILAVTETWQGANSYAFIRAFRRGGHSVTVVADEAHAASGWQSLGMRLVRRALWPMILREANAALVREAERLRPHLLFIAKGVLVRPEAICAVQRQGGVAINFWPDTSFVDHGRAAIASLPCYDWVFTTKSFGPADFTARFGHERVSFLPHGFDPETHRPMALDASDRARLACDASFIGAWSPKKQALLEAVAQALPGLVLKVWGPGWTRRRNLPFETGDGLYGAEYAKAIAASRINIAILYEGNRNAPAADRITSRTFHIPASGGFMLHEASPEIGAHFRDGIECATFSDGPDLAAKITHYLADDGERTVIAEAGCRRALASGYSIDARAEVVIEKARELLAS